MSNRKQLCLLMFTLSLILTISVATLGKDSSGQSAGQNMGELKFVTFPGLPTCATMSVESGDPSKGASIILAKATKGCIIPRHWHTPNENVMMVSGVSRIEMKDGKPLTLTAGGFAMMPSYHVHQFKCVNSYTLFLYTDAAFDFHYISGKGEITPSEAMKAVKETAATEMK
jgi:quercetin dioxygenase-like cupin family protein